jgi:hypothetical protein
MIAFHPGHRRLLLLRQLVSNWGVIRIFLLYSVAFFLPEVASIIAERHPNIQHELHNRFWHRVDYQLQDFYYIQWVGDRLKIVLIVYASASLASKYSTALFLSICCFLIFAIGDLFMFLWNASHWVHAYWCFLWCTLVFAWAMIWPYKAEKLGRIKSIF